MRKNKVLAALPALLLAASGTVHAGWQPSGASATSTFTVSADTDITLTGENIQGQTPGGVTDGETIFKFTALNNGLEIPANKLSISAPETDKQWRSGAELYVTRESGSKDEPRDNLHVRSLDNKWTENGSPTALQGNHLYSWDYKSALPQGAKAVLTFNAKGTQSLNAGKYTLTAQAHVFRP